MFLTLCIIILILYDVHLEMLSYSSFNDDGEIMHCNDQQAKQSHECSRPSPRSKTGCWQLYVVKNSRHYGSAGTPDQSHPAIKPQNHLRLCFSAHCTWWTTAWLADEDTKRLPSQNDWSFVCDVKEQLRRDDGETFHIHPSRSNSSDMALSAMLSEKILKYITNRLASRGCTHSFFWTLFCQ
jgi:hypothetical protein